MEEKKYNTKSMNISKLFKAKDYLLLDMVLDQEVEDNVGDKTFKELYDGPFIIDRCKAYSVRHAYEMFRERIRDEFSVEKMFISELEHLEDFIDSEGNTKEKWGFVVTVTSIKTEEVNSFQYYIVEDSQFVQEMIDMQIRVEL